MTNFIRARIEDGTYKPHELMPSVNKLSAETGYSRHTITKALRILQQAGLVARVPGLGYSPTSKPTPDHAFRRVGG